MKKHRGRRKTAGISNQALLDRSVLPLALFFSLFLWPVLARGDLPGVSLEANQSGCEVELKASLAYHDDPPPCIFDLYRINEKTDKETLIFQGNSGQYFHLECDCRPYNPDDLGDATDLVHTPCRAPGVICDDAGKIYCHCIRHCLPISDRPGAGTFSYRAEAMTGQGPSGYVAKAWAWGLTFPKECSDATMANDGDNEADRGCATESGRDDAPWVVFLGLLLIGMATWRRPSRAGKD